MNLGQSSPAVAEPWSRRPVVRFVYVLTTFMAIFVSLRSELLIPKRFDRSLPVPNRGSYHEDTLPICVTDATNATTIQSFLSQMDRPDDWLLLKWNADGNFDVDRMQNKTHYQQWAPSIELLGNTKPSPYGRVALLLNSDRVPLVNWTIEAPVPVWTFSKPRSMVDPRSINISDTPGPCDLDNVSVVANPYDTGTWNKFCIEWVNKTMVTRSFADKINKVVWRGAIHSPLVEQSRIALLDYSRNELEASNHGDWLDVYEVNSKDDPNHLDFYELAEYRYHLDLGGLSGTAWGGLRWKMCSGLLVFKVQSWASDWWYDTLTPWAHYIPVRSDMSDLYAQYKWTQEHLEEAEAIAEAGRLKCLETYLPETAKAQYRSVVQNLQEAPHDTVKEAEDLLEQLSSLNVDFTGLPSIDSSKAWWNR